MPFPTFSMHVLREQFHKSKHDFVCMSTFYDLFIDPLRSYVCEYVELHFQEGEPLLCHGTTKRGTTICSTG